MIRAGDLAKLREIRHGPAQQVLPQECPSGLAPEHEAGVVRLGRLRVEEGSVEAKECGQVIRLGGRHQPDRAPEAGDAVACLAAEHPLRPEMHRCVRIRLEQEDGGVLRGIRYAGQPKRLGDPRVTGQRALAQDPEGAKQVRARGARRRA